MESQMPPDAGRQAAWLLSAWGVTFLAGLLDKTALAALVLVTLEQQ
jgi:hypothetical protein